MSEKPLVYYLETNALYALGRNVLKVLPNSYTSALSIVELVSSIKESDYNKIRWVITNLVNSKMEIVWKRPEEITTNSFRVSIMLKDNTIECLQFIMNAIYDNDNYQSFKNCIDRIELTFDQTYFKHVDESAGSSFIDTTKNFIELLYKQAKGEKDFELLQNLNDRPWNKDLTLQAIVIKHSSQNTGS